MEQQTWVTLLAVAGFAVALAGLILTIKRDQASSRQQLLTEIRDSRTEAKADYTRLEAQIGAVDARLDGRLVALESRVHDIALRLPAAATSPEPAA